MATNATNPSLTPNATPNLDAYVEKLISIQVYRLIRRRAIPRHDREDWEQDLRLAVLTSIADFDSTKASWHTYANGVVTRMCSRMLRDRSIEHRNIVPMEAVTGKNRTHDERFDAVAPDGTGRTDTQVLVQTVRNSLEGDQRMVADAIMKHGITGARRSLGWTKWRYYAARNGVATALRSVGCDEA